jgi:hypothetical protein
VQIFPAQLAGVEAGNHRRGQPAHLSISYNTDLGGTGLSPCPAKCSCGCGMPAA